jgi:hypothetical protein
VYYRDVATIRALGIVGSDRDYAEMGSGMVEALLAMEAGLEDWQSAAPELAFLDALESGAVTASGHPFVLLQLSQGTTHAKSERRNIEPDEWLDIRFYDASHPFDKATTVYPRGLAHGAKASAGFTDIWFSRADLTAAFPGDGANQVVRLAAAAEPQVGPGSLSDFIRNNARLAEARAAVRAESAESVTKGAWERMLTRHFIAAGGSFKATAFGAQVDSVSASLNRLQLSLDEMNRRADRADAKAARG